MEQTTNELKGSDVLAKDRQEPEDLWQRYGAKRGVWTLKMLEALEQGVKGNKWFSLMDKVCRLDVLAMAAEKVVSNAGGCGVDNMTVHTFQKTSQDRLLAVNKQLKEGCYQPLVIKRKWIPKSFGSGERPLGIPAVVDRVVQTALKMVIEPIFEKEFAPRSYGFRPGRGCKHALREVDNLWKAERNFIVDIDIKGYFDSIPQDKLMEKVKERIADGRVLKLIEAYLKQKVMDGLEEWQPDAGTPQGGVISPLLANIYLNDLDWIMEGRGLPMVRYADDMVILCQSKEGAEEALRVIQKWMTEAGLTLHPEKTRIVDMTEKGAYLEFLGYQFKRTLNGKRNRFPRKKSLKKFKEKIKAKTRRTNGTSLNTIVEEINPIIMGWFGYFKNCHKQTFKDVDGWIRGRFRGILRKRRGGKGRGRGSDHKLWTNHYFDTLGLVNLTREREWSLTVSSIGAKH